MIEDSDTPSHFCEVKAHTGKVDNESADIIDITR